MELEDFLSGIPPLSQPTSVRLAHANAHTLWLEWDCITQHNITKKPVTAVTYSLYMRRGFHNMLPGDRVSVVVPETASAASTNKKKRGVKPVKTMRFPDPLDMLFDDSLRRFEGEVLAAHSTGSFDVLFDDGTIERQIPRHRMKLLYTSTAFNATVSNDLTEENYGGEDDVSAMTSVRSVLTRSEGTVTSEAVRKRRSRQQERKRRQLSRVSEISSSNDVIETAPAVSILDSLKSKRSTNNARTVSTSMDSAIDSHQRSSIQTSETPTLSRASKKASRSVSRSKTALDMADIVRNLNSRRSLTKSAGDELDDLLDVCGDSASVGSTNSADSNALVPTVPPPPAPLW